MGWSWRIGRLAGIGVYVHFTFLILLAWVGFSHYAVRGSAADALAGVGFILALFGIVVLHELGHALAARRYGITTRDITLLPIGGVARLERMPEDPRQELVVALAGPAVNVALAAALFVVLRAGDGLAGYGSVARVGGHFLNQMLWVNVSLALFNLLPAFPMDGGRVLRALLAMRMDYARATQAAARVGQGMALLFGFAGLMLNPFLLFIALFVWVGASGEAALVQMRSALANIPVANATVTDLRVLAPGDPLARAVEHVLAGFQQDFPVADGGRPVGVLTRGDLVAALARLGPEAPVGDVMSRDFETVDPLEMLDAALTRSRGSGRPLAVVRNGGLVGMVTPESVSELVMIREALRHSPPTGLPTAGAPSPAARPTPVA